MVRFDLSRGSLARPSKTEDCHRGLKQCTGVEKVQVRLARIQTPIEFALRAFLCLEIGRLHIGISWYEARASPIRKTVSPLSAPLFPIPRPEPIPSPGP